MRKEGLFAGYDATSCCVCEKVRKIEVRAYGRARVLYDHDDSMLLCSASCGLATKKLIE